MIPSLDNTAALKPAYHQFLGALRTSRYAGEIMDSLSDRIIMSTDNSIYQLTPEIVLYPKTTDDLLTILSLAPKHPDVHFAPRGGGTGTDGQSLTDGIVIDCSKYLTKILEINLSENWARVQPGVILDQLNDTLKEHGLYLPVNISTSNRATIGGMVNTDACGQGSFRFGRMSRHLLECKLVLNDGTLFSTRKRHARDMRTHIDAILTEHDALIQEQYPKIPRHATGYNLANIKEGDDLNLNYLIAGSEGTLGVLSEVKLSLSPIIKHKKCLLLCYPSFNDALVDAEALREFKPAAIEVMDEMLASLIKSDTLYPKVKHLIDETTKTITLVEFHEDNADDLSNKIDRIQNTLSIPNTLIEEPDVADALWQCRKKSVGLLGKSDTYKRPIPFVEDATVHPSDLAPYIRDFRKILDEYTLEYGMFGHADSGCIHVRPALDLTQEHDEKLIKEISQKIYALTNQYNGILWGEHGLGFRSAYNPDYFGDTLYKAFQRIKTLFDPTNQLNPGKVASPQGSSQALYDVDGPLRAHTDKEIDFEKAGAFDKSAHCNGNGLCFSYKPNDVMCPSYKATGDRKHSPKGRAALLRAWITKLKHYDFNKEIPKANFFRRLLNSTSKNDFSTDVFEALEGCLGCKACKTSCPINVVIPEMKSHFLHHYYQRYSRPVKDFFISRSELLVERSSKIPRLSNALTGITSPIIGMCDTPKLPTKSLATQLPKSHVSLKNIASSNSERSVILYQDALTSFYEPQTIIALEKLIQKLGHTLYIPPFKENGKPKHVLGYRDQFTQTAKDNLAYLKKIAKLNIPIIGIDPSITLTYRDEYKSLGDIPPVLLVQEWLKNLDHKSRLVKNETYYLLAHCTEKTASLDYLTDWQAVFNAFNLTLEILPTGCCGMAGAYGLQKKHRGTSEKIYELSWKTHIETLPHDKLLATGFSCRRQVERFAGVRLMHPIEALV